MNDEKKDMKKATALLLLTSIAGLNKLAASPSKGTLSFEIKPDQLINENLLDSSVDIPTLIQAIKAIETPPGYVPGRKIVHKVTKATGPLQIRPVLLKDVKRIYPNVPYEIQDMQDFEKAKKIFLAYVYHYLKQRYQRVKKPATIVDVAKLWHAGPSMQDKSSYSQNVLNYYNYLNKIRIGSELLKNKYKSDYNRALYAALLRNDSDAVKALYALTNDPQSPYYEALKKALQLHRIHPDLLDFKFKQMKDPVRVYEKILNYLRKLSQKRQ